MAGYSHGEAFLQMMKAWMYPGILFMDEPESALSPQKQLTLLTYISDMVEDRGRCGRRLHDYVNCRLTMVSFGTYR